MTTIFKTLSKSVLAAIIASTLSVAPASADGQIQIDIKPQNAKQAKGMRTGLALYSLVQGIKSQGGIIRQNGNGNSAGVGQNGSGNQGIVHQQGDGHNGSIRQVGNNNSHGLFQFGKNTNSHVHQNGNGGTGMTFAFGW